MPSGPALLPLSLAVWLVFISTSATADSLSRNVPATGLPGIALIIDDLGHQHGPEPEAIRKQFRRLLDIARKQGAALGIGHPHAATLQVLREEIENLEIQGVELIPVARLIAMQNRRNESWHAYLSR